MSSSHPATDSASTVSLPSRAAKERGRTHAVPLESTSRLAWRASLDIDSPQQQSRQDVRKTGIVCTIGPASSTPEGIRSLRRAGMNIARLNMSHGTHEQHESVVKMIRASEATDGMAASGYRPVGIALDTKGPEIRLSKSIRNAATVLSIEMGQEYEIGFGDESNERLLAIDYPSIGATLSVGSKVYIDDGNLQLQVVKIVDRSRVMARALNSHRVKPGKAVNLPYALVELPSVSEKDEADLRFAARLGLDMVFASFVRKAADVVCIRRILDSCATSEQRVASLPGSPNPGTNANTLPRDIKIIAKIENHEGVQNIDQILDVADGIMVARGDLGVELLPEKVFVAQKMLIARAGILGKPVICATQMLESMTMNPRPTRAEATDVANAVLDGADCVMLSAETASGLYPAEAVTLMSAVCLQAEAVIAYQPLFEEIRQLQLDGDFDMSETVACSAVSATLHAPSAIRAIIVLSTSGHSARLVAKYRPRVPIIVITRYVPTARSLHLHRGCYPFIYDGTSAGEEGREAEWQRDVDQRFYWAITRSIEQGLLQHGDRVVCIQGSKGGVGHTNTMRILLVP